MSVARFHFPEIERLYRLRTSDARNFTRLTDTAQASLKRTRNSSEIEARAKLFPGTATHDDIDHTAQTVLALRDGIILKLHSLNNTAKIPKEVNSFLDTLIRMGVSDEAKTQEWESLDQAIKNDFDRKNSATTEKKSNPNSKLNKLIKTKPKQVRELAESLDLEIQKKLPAKKEDAILELQRRVFSFQPPDKTYAAATTALKQLLNQQLTRNISLPRLELQNELEKALGQVKEKCTKAMIEQGLETLKETDPWYGAGGLSNSGPSPKPGRSGRHLARD